MPIRHYFFALLGCAALTACDSHDSTVQEVKSALGYKPKPEVVKPAQSRYCYKTYEDVICYSRPLAGEEYRLVGFQTPSGKTGYTLPSSVAPDDLDTDPPLPKLKAVVVNSPPPVKGTDEKQLKEIIFDPAELQPKELVPEKQE